MRGCMLYFLMTIFLLVNTSVIIMYINVSHVKIVFPYMTILHCHVYG